MTLSELLEVTLPRQMHALIKGYQAGVAERDAEIAELKATLAECRSSIKFDLLHYERQAIAYGKLGVEGGSFHSLVEVEANRLFALIDKIDAITENTNAALAKARKL